MLEEAPWLFWKSWKSFLFESTPFQYTYPLFIHERSSFSRVLVACTCMSAFQFTKASQVVVTRVPAADNEQVEEGLMPATRVCAAECTRTVVQCKSVSHYPLCIVYSFRTWVSRKFSFQTNRNFQTFRLPHSRKANANGSREIRSV